MKATVLLASAALMFGSCFAGVDAETGLYSPDWIDDGNGGEYLSFDRTVKLYGLVDTYDADTAQHYYLGSATINVGKTSKKTKTSKLVCALSLGDYGKMTFSAPCSWSSPAADSEGVATVLSNKFGTMEIPNFEWSPLEALSALDLNTTPTETTVKCEIYDGTLSNLAELKGKGYVVTLFRADDQTAQVNLTIGAKGRVAVSGTDFAGNKIKTFATFVTGMYTDGDGFCFARIPVYIPPMKDGTKGMGFYIYLEKNSDGWMVSMDNGVYCPSASGVQSLSAQIGVIGGLANGRYSLDASKVEGLLGDYVASLSGVTRQGVATAAVLGNYLYCSDIQVENDKITVSKAGTVRLAKSSDAGGNGSKPMFSSLVNPMGLKLSYKAKTGELTGSFSAYVIVETQMAKGSRTTLKKVPVKLAGFVVDGEVNLTATVKKYGSTDIDVSYEGLVLHVVAK